MVVILLLVALVVPVIASAAGFDAAVLSLPQQTYGPAREPCESPSGSAVTLSPTGNWQRALESGAPGTRFFLQAGTYQASDITLAPGITVKPLQCAAVTLRGRVRPGSNATLAGVTVDARTGTTNVYAGDATIRLDRTTSGVTIRNSLLTQDDHYGIAVTASHQRLTIQGNELRVPSQATSNNVLWVNGACQGCTFSDNKLVSLGGPADLAQFWYWSGTWTLARNWFGASPTKGNHLDIKLSQPGTSGNVLEVVNNYFDGRQLNVDGYGCVITHNASDRGVGSGYSYTVNATGNYFLGCRGSVWDHRISTGAGERDPTGRTLRFTYNVIHNPGDVGRLLCESDNCHVEHNTFVGAELKVGAGGYVPRAVAVHNNIFYQTRFTNPGNISVCSHNDFYQVSGAPGCASSITGDPRFVHLASNWQLQPGSPAIGAGIGGATLGALSNAGPVPVPVPLPAPYNLRLLDIP